MKTIKINPSFCPQDHNCPVISACPVGAIIQRSPNDVPTIDEEKCTGCGRCSKFCRTFTLVDRN
ncbi:MAG: 4Fe-4S binding protein [Salinivirgaceae bacterium]|nr:4Fe-4S binding protein [Salinivirgaceae bacterium]MDD4748234.1 4Fe-4S binding protein [Salinivirgaceae bacterium]MDY0280826.1 4Fe-4S binding protein [Salinivirgaceae bacterium]